MDLDPQGNASSGVGVSPRTVEKSIYDALIGRATLREVMQSTALSSLWLVPSKQDLVAVEVELIDDPDRPYKLRAALREHLAQESYDWVIIDCPPVAGDPHGERAGGCRIACSCRCSASTTRSRASRRSCRPSIACAAG